MADAVVGLWRRRQHHPDPDLEAALAALSEQDLELVALIVWDGFGVAEAGALLGLRPDAARQRYARARSRLRGALNEAEAVRPVAAG